MNVLKLFGAAAIVAASVAMGDAAQAGALAPVKVQAKAVEAMSPIVEVRRKWRGHRQYGWRGNRWNRHRFARFRGQHRRGYRFRPRFYDPFAGGYDYAYGLGSGYGIYDYAGDDGYGYGYGYGNGGNCHPGHRGYYLGY